MTNVVENWRYATEDGVLRNPQVDFDRLGPGPWDGIRHSYIPRPELTIAPALELHTAADLDVDPITYQVLRSRLWHQNLEHGDIIQRITGSSPVIYSKDFATALLTEDGDAVVVSPTIQFFSSLADLVVKWTLENRSGTTAIAAGDVFLQNSPFVAAGQQPDTAVFAPIFVAGRLFAWAYNALHMGDLGGVDPGGWAVHARDKYEDGAATPPVKIVDAGSLRSDVVDLWVAHGRDPETLRLNVNSGIASVRAMTERVKELVDERGAATVKGVMRKMIADCSRIVGDRLAEIPDGSWSRRLYVTGATGVDRETHQEVLTVVKRGRHITCSNAGTAPQKGPGNSTYSILRSAIIAALGSALGWDQQGCFAGIADHVLIEPTFGTRNCANPPAATSALHSVFVTMNLAGLVVSSMLLSAPAALRKRATASGGLSVAMADISFGLNEDFSLVAPPITVHGSPLGGAIGAFPNRDGIDSAGSWFMLGTSAGNVESYEQEGVGLVLYRREIQDGGGPGRWRGGNGVSAAWIPHHAFASNAQMAFVEPSTNLASGLAGGYFALAGNFLRTNGGVIGRALEAGRVPGSREQIEAEIESFERLHPQGSLMPVPPGDAVVIEYNGGGGYGDPLTREIDLVATDLAEQRISASAARRFWGVVLGEDGIVNVDATVKERDAIRTARLVDAHTPVAADVPSGRPEVLLEGAAGSVDIARYGDITGWGCTNCGAWLGDVASSYLSAAAWKQHSPHEVDDRMYVNPAEFGDTDIVLRQYFCPSCAALLSQDICHFTDDPRDDFRFDPTFVSNLERTTR